MESYRLSGRLCGPLDLVQTVVSTLHGSLQIDAEPVMVKLQNYCGKVPPGLGSSD